jgi:hypothetical protein
LRRPFIGNLNGYFKAAAHRHAGSKDKRLLVKMIQPFPRILKADAATRQTVTVRARTAVANAIFTARQESASAISRSEARILPNHT